MIQVRQYQVLTYKQGKVAKARELIQAIVDDWANKPKPIRDGGIRESSGGGGWTKADNGGDAGGEVEVVAAGGWATGGDAAVDTGSRSWDAAPTNGGGW